MNTDLTERGSSPVLDEFLVVQSQMGDAGAFARLVERWQHRLLRYAFHFTQDAEAARDVAQESWIAVIRGLRSLEDPARFRAWLFRIAANKARDWVRRERTARRASRQTEPAAQEPEPTSSADSLRRVRSALAGLEPEQRLILTSFYLDGLRVGEIAHALDIPVGTVKSRLHHARSVLRATLEETECLDPTMTRTVGFARRSSRPAPARSTVTMRRPARTCSSACSGAAAAGSPSAGPCSPSSS